ncbi:hypothetical protein Rhopal_000710-T1 [Rhodotorula paludigena]|uniref:TRAF-type domain-containing protein n=1 Tax=Rhodotorula paludigena TaxID=86838 RepID=A0AAV5G5T1_9BASI|nr:hypothetical protein Rhopal_000710-T1 [Rhodotorula paludigena]
MPAPAAERFVAPLPDDMRCSDCAQAAYPPIAVCLEADGPCVLCSTCWCKWRDGWCFRKLCPWCSAPKLAEPKESRLYHIKFESLKLRCEHNECDWIGTLKQLIAHERKCKFRLVQCYVCFHEYESHEAAAHTTVCDGRQVQCPRGGMNCCGTPRSGVYRFDREHEHENAGLEAHLLRAKQDLQLERARRDGLQELKEDALIRAQDAEEQLEVERGEAATERKRFRTETAELKSKIQIDDKRLKDEEALRRRCQSLASERASKIRDLEARIRQLEGGSAVKLEREASSAPSARQRSPSRSRPPQSAPTDRGGRSGGGDGGTSLLSRISRGSVPSQRSSRDYRHQPY